MMSHTLQECSLQVGFITDWVSIVQSPLATIDKSIQDNLQVTEFMHLRLLALIGTILPHISCFSITNQRTDQSSLETIIQIKILSPSHPYHGRTLLAIPAMFGMQSFDKIIAPVYLSHSNALCTPYTPYLPILSQSDLQLLNPTHNPQTGLIPYTNYANTSKWIHAVPRGHCAFDIKSLQIQSSGFLAGLIFNDGQTTGIHPPSYISTTDPSSAYDIPIRMSSNTVGDFIHIPSMFLPYSEMKTILGINGNEDAFSHIPDAFVISIERVEWDYFKHGTFSTPSYASLISVVLFYISVAMLCASLSMMIVICYGMVRNYYCYGAFLYSEHGIKAQPKLKKVEFPIFVFEEGDLEEDVCCAICIDDFGVGNCARVLPCGHRFHTTW